MSTAVSVNSAPSKILAIIVIYKQLPRQSESLKSLAKAQEKVSLGKLRLTILVADNTPGGQTILPEPDVFRYRAYPENPGLAKPYNDALRTAETEGFDWLLTLDQDTSLPPDFLVGMAEGIRSYGAHQDVSALVPRIQDGAKPISPFRFRGGFLPVVVPKQTSGILGSHASALNSASLLRVKTTRDLGGYDESFPLHNSDTRLYQKLDKAGKRVAVVPGVLVSHEFSILDRAGRMSPERYARMLRDECAFWDWHMSFAARAERVLRLIGRYCKGILRHEQGAFQEVTRKEIGHRLFHSRRARQKKNLLHAMTNITEPEHGFELATEE